MNTEKNILKKGRITYYWGSRFFSKGSRDDVFKLYSFVRVVSDFAQIHPKDVANFEYLEHRWETIKKDLIRGKVPTPLDASASERVLANIAYIVHRFRCDPAWVDAFFKSMRWDLQQHEYRSLKDTLAYIYGSSEVVGLFLVRILNLPEEALGPARTQGRAVSYIHLLRDIQEQNAAGYTHLPMNEYKKYGLKNLSEEEARNKPKMFTDFMHAQLLRYANWQAEANEGFMYVPKRLRIPMQTAVDSYNWTAQQLKNDPLLVYEQRPVKPKKRRVITGAIKRSLRR